jgi:hypothetical protein
MEDLRKRVKDERSFLEKVGKLIPGYSGYKEKLIRQEGDKLLRDWLAGKLQIQMGYLKDLIDEMTRAMKIKLLDHVDRPLKKLEKLRDRIKYADRGYTGWFAAVDVGKDLLDRMYEFDNALIDLTDEIEQLIRAAQAAISDDEKLVAALKALTDLIAQADVNYGERENLILNKTEG